MAFYLAGEITQVKRVNTLGPLCLWQCFVVVQVKSLPFVFIYFCCRPDEIFFCFLFDDDDKNMIQIDNSGLDNNNDDDWLNGDNGVLNDNDHTMIRI